MTQLSEQPTGTIAKAFEHVPHAVSKPKMGLRGLVRLYFDQHKVIFKGQTTCGQAWAQVRPHEDVEIVELNVQIGRRSLRSAALFASAQHSDGRPHPAAASQPTLLFFYGNDMCLSRSDAVIRMLRRCGCNVMVPEYVGYGMSEGVPNEKACYATADAAYTHLLTRPGVDPTKLVAMGVSLGGAVAIDLAARRPLMGLVTMVTFSSLGDLARHVLPRLPVRLILRYRFNSLQKMALVRCPVLIGHSFGDELIPHAMADRLAAAAGGKVTRLNLHGVNHSKAEMLKVAESEILPAMSAFLADISRADPSVAA